jgi:hypothetical protein
MRIKDISINKGMTIHIGNRQYHKVEVGMTATVDEDVATDLDTLTELVNVKLAAEIKKVMPAPKKQTLMEKAETESAA